LSQKQTRNLKKCQRWKWNRLTDERKEPILIALFDFSRLRTEPDKFAHLRIIGGTGVGKTTFVDWLLDVLGGERFVITPKKKSWNWVV
jgi:polynucleotide 5'-kinase involved in rRNA processing